MVNTVQEKNSRVPIPARWIPLFDMGAHFVLVRINTIFIRKLHDGSWQRSTVRLLSLYYH